MEVDYLWALRFQNLCMLSEGLFQNFLRSRTRLRRYSPPHPPLQTAATLLGVTCCDRLHTHTLLHVVAQKLKLVKLLSQQPPTFLLFRDRRGAA